MLGFASVSAAPVGALLVSGIVSRPGSDIGVSSWAYTAPDFSSSINEATRDDTSYAEGSFSGVGAITTLTPSRLPGVHLISFAGNYLASVDSGRFRFSMLDDANTVLGATYWQPVSTTTTQYDLLVAVTGGTATRIKIDIQA